MPENGESTDQITPSVVEDQIRAHDRTMRDGRKMWAMYKSTYMTRYWEYMAGERLPRNPRAFFLFGGLVPSCKPRGLEPGPGWAG